MREFIELYNEKISQGLNSLRISNETGVFPATIRRLATKKQFGVNPENYKKLKEYFGEDFLINGNDPCDRAKTKLEIKKVRVKPKIDNLIIVMMDMGITKQELAAMSGIDRADIYRLLNGDKLLGEKYKTMISDALEIDADELFGDKPIARKFQPKNKIKWGCNDCCYKFGEIKDGSLRHLCKHPKSTKTVAKSGSDLISCCPGIDEGWDEVVEWAERINLGENIKLDWKIGI